MINVLGDALAAGIMAHICKKDFDKSATTASAAVPAVANKERVRTVSVSIYQSSHKWKISKILPKSNPVYS